MVKRLVAVSLHVGIMLVLLTSSCIGPIVGYYESPKWLLEDAIEGDTLFVAFTADGEFHVKMFSPGSEVRGQGIPRYLVRA